MNERNFFAELKRRNVYKVAIAYAVVGWLVIQIASTILPTFHAPEWVVQTLIVIVALGFPIALVLAWAFEMTPEGMKRTEDVRPDEKIPQGSRRKFAALILVIAIAAASLLGYQVFRAKPMSANPSGAANVPLKSIAVLPFENLSEDKANAYFAEGIRDEILTRLSKIAAPVLQLQGHLPEAIAEYKRTLEIEDNPKVLALLANAYASIGQRDEALKLLAQLEERAAGHYIGLYNFALAHAGLGDKEGD